MAVPGFTKFVLAPGPPTLSGSPSEPVDPGHIDASALPPRAAVRVDWPAHYCESSCGASCDGNTIIELITAAAGETPSGVIVTIPAPDTFRLTLPASKLPRGILYEWRGAAAYGGRLAHAIYVPVEHADAFGAANAALAPE